MMRSVLCLAVGLLSFSATANSATFLFNADPFPAGSPAEAPGRQIIANELFINDFDVATDVFALDQGVFGVSSISFFSDVAANVPASGANTIVLQNSDVPFAAGLAANLIAAQVTTPGPGFFVYFNTTADAPRLVYSTDLSSADADLKILARLTNLSAPGGRLELANFTSANFAAVPEPSSMLLTGAGALMACGWAWRRRRTNR